MGAEVGSVVGAVERRKKGGEFRTYAQIGVSTGVLFCGMQDDQNGSQGGFTFVEWF